MDSEAWKRSHLEKINSVVVTRDELLSILKEIERRIANGEETRDAALFIPALKYKPDATRASAVSYRLIALTDLVETGAARGWILPKGTNGGVPIRYELIAAAATEPLIEVGTTFQFNVASILAAAMRMAEPEGSA